MILGYLDLLELILTFISSQKIIIFTLYLIIKFNDLKLSLAFSFESQCNIVKSIDSKAFRLQQWILSLILLFFFLVNLARYLLTSFYFLFF